MKPFCIALATSAFAPYITALSHDELVPTASALSIEHYCFPKFSTSSAVNDLLPSMTMIYSGITLTTTPTLVTISAEAPTTPFATAYSISTVSNTSLFAPGNSSSSPTLERTSNIASDTRPTASSSGVQDAESALVTDEREVASSPASSISISMGSSTLQQSSTQVPTSLPLPAGRQPAELSSVAVDALQLAQYLKNAIAAIFDVTRLTARSEHDTSLLSSLVANISTQEHAHQQILRRLLHDAGSAEVPPCMYTIPDSFVDAIHIMSGLKSVETGLFITIADSLPASDAPLGVVLTNMATVASRQNAMLQAYIHSNSSAGPFETPISAIWAYNFAALHVLPGSCTVELPIPILPTLAVGDGLGFSVFRQSNTNVSFAWDAAGTTAAARSGKPLSVGWVNQIGNPQYTPLVVVSDGIGITTIPAGLLGTAFAVLTAQPGLDSIDDLTKATIAGPVMIKVGW